MNRKIEKTDYGIIVARFQTPYLHEAHKKLIDFVKSEVDQVIVFLGLAPSRATKNNPLDFDSRRIMIQDEYPDIKVGYIEDSHSDEVWSYNLDNQVSRFVNPSCSVALYGGRDSFLKVYRGKYKNLVELESDTFISGTELRRLAGIQSKKTLDWRAGVVWATQQRFPTCYPCADVLVYDDGRVLMSRKTHESGYRTSSGGFVNPGESWEQAALRELFEEVKGIEVDRNIKYVKSFPIDDFRYRSEQDKITASLFVAKYLYGIPRANDDICECKWVPYDEAVDLAIPDHKEMVREGINFIKKLK